MCFKDTSKPPRRFKPPSFSYPIVVAMRGEKLFANFGDRVIADPTSAWQVMRFVMVGYHAAKLDDLFEQNL